MELLALLALAWVVFGPIAGLVIAVRAQNRVRELGDQLRLLRKHTRDLELLLGARAASGERLQVPDAVDPAAEVREARLPRPQPSPLERIGSGALEAARAAIPAVPGEQPNAAAAVAPGAAAMSAQAGAPGRPAPGQTAEAPQPLVSPPPIPPRAGQGAQAPTMTSRLRRRPIAWEQLLGVRGAALLGGLLFALAAVLLFKHAFDEGWIKPPVRVALGYAAALAGLGASTALSRSKLLALPGALAGAGLVAAYASTWAAHRLYGYLNELGAMPLFVAITALGGWLAVRRRSQATAAIGLLGGYATPLLLLVEEPSAPGFFGYMLLMQAGVLWVCLRSRLTWLPLAALFLGGGLQVFWWLRFQGAEQGPVLLLALGLQALLATALGLCERWPLLDLARYLTLAGIGLWATLLSGDGDWLGIGPGLGLLLGLVLGAALYVDRRLAPALPLAPFLSAASALAMSISWEQLWALGPWTFSACLRAVLVGSLPLFVLWIEGLIGRESNPTWRRAMPGAVGGVVGALAALLPSAGLMAPGQLALLLPFCLALLVLWTRRSPALSSGLGPSPLAAAAALVAVPGSLGFRTLLGPAPGLWPWPLAILGALALLAALSARWAGSPELGRARGAYAGLALAAWTLLGPAQAPALPGLPLLCSAALVLAAGLSLAGGLPLFSWLALPCMAFSQGAWARAFGSQDFDPPAALLALALLGLGVAWLSLRRRPAHPASGAAWALTPLALLPALDFLGQGYRAPYRILPEALLGGQGAFGWPAALALLCALVARFGPAAEEAVPGRRLAWALAGLLAGAALGRLLEGPSALIALAGALFGAAGLGLRFDSARPSLAPALTASIAALELLLGTWRVLLEGHQAFDPRFVSLEAAVLAALALVAGAAARRLAGSAEPGPRLWLGARALSLPVGVAALWFGLLSATALALDAGASDGERISLSATGSSNAQTAVSLAWGAYALGLLVFGQRRGLAALRKGSLAVLSLALAKLFLFDLSDLRGLYRVASIAGLASSLVLVSWIYQRQGSGSRPGPGGRP